LAAVVGVVVVEVVLVVLVVVVLLDVDAVVVDEVEAVLLVVVVDVEEGRAPEQNGPLNMFGQMQYMKFFWARNTHRPPL
jgi:hypothetical protein